ncbi:hypothetical protein Cgig2_015263 [Carnegiea gigantea]|uniref:Uncharacterized protein n=1 Tax=Carnegiea gigantea TaxID=171969 RepID=A0A9Q1Q8U4_9CARY|nr:hypothetical protein Cgig2_015263 [Carnegiea gigantea]
MSYRSKRTLTALGTKSSETAQPAHPNSSTVTTQSAIQSDFQPPTQPTSSVVHQPPAHPSTSTPQHTTPFGPLRPKKKATAPTAALAVAPLIRLSTVRFEPFQPCPTTNNNESHPPSQPAIEVLRGATQQEVHQKIACQESREPPSNSNNEDLSSQSKFVDKGKGLDGGKKKKSTTSKSTRSSRSSWKDDIQFDAKEQVLTIDDQGNEGVINGSIPPRDVMNYKKGVRFCVAFNNYNQPIRKGGYIFVRFLGYITRLERFCPIETISWHELNKTYKANIIEMVRNEASAKVQERLLSSSPSKTQVELENEVFDELMYEEEYPKRPIGFGFNVDRSDIFGVNSILRKRGYIFPGNNVELKPVKEELASQKAMFLLMLKVVRNGKITYEFLDATEAALRMASNQVQQESSGNDLSNESRHTGPSTSTSQVN